MLLLITLSFRLCGAKNPQEEPEEQLAQTEAVLQTEVTVQTQPTEETAESTRERIEEIPETTSDAGSFGPVRMQKIQMGELSFLEFSRADMPMPIIFLQHGLGGYKEEFIGGAEYLAEYGYRVILVDAYGHGEQAMDSFVNLPDIIEKSSQQYDRILAFYRGKYANQEPIFSIMGISLGGLTGLYHAAYGAEHPRCVCSLYATPEWDKFPGTYAVYAGVEKGGWSWAIESQYEYIDEQFRRSNPIKNPDQLFSSHILMINGDKDDIIPWVDYERLRYKAEDGITPEFILREDQGHDMASGDFDDSVTFLLEHMPPYNP